MFGWMVDQGHPRLILGASVAFMLATVELALAGERGEARRMRAAAYS